MSENKVLIPVDFSAASEKAIEFGVLIANELKGSISLLHVFEDDSLSLDACNSELKRMADRISLQENIDCDCLCEKGDIFTIIPAVASRNAYKIVVAATHGRQGIRQKFFGADIIKLLKKIPKPTLVVQEHSQLPDEGFKRAIFAVGGHDAYERKIQAMVFFAGIFNPEIHLYSISRPGIEQTDKFKENIRLAEKSFSEKGINFRRVSEDQNVFSVGFAKQTLKYAGQQGADLITIMVNPTRENYYFADSDKEAILTNESGIAVLSVSNAEPNL